MPPVETRVSALQRQLAQSPDDPNLHLELAREFEALRYRDEAVNAYLSAARAFERRDVIAGAVAALQAALAIEPHHQYARRQHERLSALAAFAEAEDLAGGPSAPSTTTAEISWGQGLMPLATADLEEVEETERWADGTPQSVASGSAVMALATGDLSFVELLEEGGEGLDSALSGEESDTTVTMQREGSGFDGTLPEVLAPQAAAPSPTRLLGPALPLRLLEGATVEAVVAGQPVYAADERADAIFQVMSGEVELGWRGPDGLLSFAWVGADTFFGELGLLANGQRVLEAMVIRSGEIARVEQAQARAHAKRDPEFDRMLRKVYRDRLVALAQLASPLFQALSREDVEHIMVVGRPLAVERGGLIVERGVRPKGVLLVLLGQLEALDAKGEVDSRVGLGGCACHRALFSQEHCANALRAGSFVQLLVLPGRWLLEAPEAKIVRFALQQQPDPAG